MNRSLAIAVAMLGTLWAPGACAAGLTWTGSSGNNQASVIFQMLTNTTLRVILTNTSLDGATSSGDVLTGFFFSSATNAPVNATSATVAPGSIHNCPACPANTTDVSGQWFAAANVSGINGTTPAYVLASTSFGFLSNTISSNHLESLRGASNVDFGLVGSNTSFGQSAFTGSPLVSQQVVFNLSVINGFSTSSIVSGGFLWGTTLVPLGTQGDFSTYSLSTTPEPGSLLLITTGLAGMAFFGRRRMNRPSKAA